MFTGVHAAAFPNVAAENKSQSIFQTKCLNFYGFVDFYDVAFVSPTILIASFKSGIFMWGPHRTLLVV